MSDIGPQEASADSNKSQINDDLVRKVADRVFKMLLEEARINNERRRPAINNRLFGQGGR